MSKPSFADTLARMKEEFAQQLPTRLAAVEGFLQDCIARPGDGEALAQLRLALHTLAGTCGTLGQPEVGARARAAEHLVAALGERDGRTAGDFEALQPRIRALATGEAP